MTDHRKLHFVGIGGAGMAPLATIALETGCRVSGSDQRGSAKCDELAAHGARIVIGHRAEALPPDADLLVYSSAVPPENPERQEAARRGLPQLRRGEWLAEVCRDRKVVAISASHGKTTTTAMLVHILRQSGADPGWMIGGSVPGLPAGHAGRDPWFVTEADESDGTHLLLRPELALMPNVDDDHEWSLGGTETLMEHFQRFSRQSRHLLYDPACAPPGFFAGHPDAAIPDPLPAGAHPALAGFLRTNAAFAVRAAERLGVPEAQALAALASFPGVERRMTLRGERGGVTLIEDYAHHPAEVEASLALLRERYPGHHLRVLFQPHRYARLAKYLDRFAAILRTADSVLVAPVFAAWSESGPADHAELARRIGPRAKAVAGSWEEIAREAAAAPERPLVIAVLGAGDLDAVFRYL